MTPLCYPRLARSIKKPIDLMRHVLIESDNKQVRWEDWFGANGLTAPAPHGSRFDRSFLAIAMAVDGLGVALESTRLAEREVKSRKLVAPLAECATDVRYVGHYLVFPRTARPRHTLRIFARWLAAELKLDFSNSL